jgi:hypothetical protein
MEPAGGHALMARRAFDVVVAGTALLAASPLLLVAVLAIRLESRGSAIYRQRRVGKDGQAFDVLKLRTMVTGAEQMGAGLAVSEGDTRITRVGRCCGRTVARRGAQSRQRPARRDGDRRPAPDGARAGRPLHRAPARAPRGQARITGLGAGQRAHRAAVGRAASSSTSGTSSIAPGAWTC